MTTMSERIVPKGKRKKKLNSHYCFFKLRKAVICHFYIALSEIFLQITMADCTLRQSKLPTPKKSTTPKRQETDAFRVSRYSTPPRHNSSLNMNKHALPESPQRLNRSLTVYGQRYSPASQRKSGEKMQESPLKENNRVIAKVKPLKLVRV